MINDLEMYELVQLFKKKWKFIVFFTLLFTLIGYLLSNLLQPTFEARTELLVNFPLNTENNTGLQSSEIDDEFTSH